MTLSGYLITSRLLIGFHRQSPVGSDYAITGATLISVAIMRAPAAATQQLRISGKPGESCVRTKPWVLILKDLSVFPWFCEQHRRSFDWIVADRRCRKRLNLLTSAGLVKQG